MSDISGQSLAPQGRPAAVVKPGEFIFAAAYPEHGHIYGQCDGLIEAGATLKWIFDPDPAKVARLATRHPGARVARAFEEILDDPAVNLVTAAAVPSERAAIGARVMRAGKDYFTDKAPFTEMAQLEETRRIVAETGRKYMVYYSERLHSECAMHATDLVGAGAIGRVLQVLGLGPHRLDKSTRPAWFFERAKVGGILCDIGSHQFEQIVTFTGAGDAEVMHAAVANYANADTPEFEDFGEASLRTSTGATGYVRVDWFTARGLGTWGDGRTIILGTNGTIELRKYIDIARERRGNQIYVVDDHGEHHIDVDGRVGYRFFGEFVLDCLQRTDKAMTQAHAFKAAEIALRAQAAARRLA